MKFRANPVKANSLFLFYYFRSPEGRNEILKYSSQVGTPGIGQPLSSLRKFRVPLPPLATQGNIAEILSAIDDKIELNRKTNETLEALARAIFKDWFVDFGPTRAKAEGREPYLAPEFWDLFPNALDDEDKPVGWALGTIADVAMLNPESWSKKNPPDQIEYVDLANTKWGTIESTQNYEWSKAPSRAQRILRPGNTIVGTVRPGNGSYAFVGQDGLTGSTGFAILAPKAAETREFVYLASTSQENIERLSHLADGAAYPAVRPDVVAATEVVVPGEKALVAFSRITAPLLDRLEAKKRENRTLAETRDILLPKLMSGKIRLKDAERIVGEVV
jgi:type I restriction enzyme S subunit